MDRPSFEEICMRIAFDISRRSTCKRRQVGCVITDPDYYSIYSWGYNGSAKGLKNECDRPDESGNCGCLHSEDNAMINYIGPRMDPKHVFVSLMPCEACCKRIINLQNVKKVFYGQPHKGNKGLALLRAAGIEPIEFPVKEFPTIQGEVRCQTEITWSAFLKQKGKKLLQRIKRSMISKKP